MRISQIGRSISESATLKLNARAAQMRAQGDPVIHLGGGEPESLAPPEAVAAATEVLSTRAVRYGPSSGTPAMKEAVIHYTEEFYSYRATKRQVIASSGAKQAIMVALQAILDPGDEVVFPVPYWVSYPDMVRLCGAVPVPAPAGDGSFYPRISDIARCLGDRARAVIINSPNNPSGAVYGAGFIREVVELCERRGLYLIMDDIYHRLAFDGGPPVSCYEFARSTGDESRLIVVNGVSKQFAMTGFRIGWAVASPELIRVMGNIQSQQTAGPSGVLQAAAVAAIHGDQSPVEKLRLTLRHNRDLLLEHLQSLDGVRVEPPDGTFYCFADFSHYDQDSARLSELLLDKVQVVTVPGAEFGMDGFLRLSFCGAVKDIIEGVERMKWALDPNSPNELYIGDRKLVRDWS